jgi:hypothetical protein
MTMPSFTDKVADELENSKASLKCVGLCTTSTAGEKELNYLSQTRSLDSGVSYLHLVLASTSDALNIIKKFNAQVDFWFVDCEVKNCAFDGTAIRKRLSGKAYNVIEPNALTIDTIMGWVSAEITQSILILGTGRLAFALAQRLHLNGYHFNWCGTEGRQTKSNCLIANAFPDKKLIKEKKVYFDLIINTIPVSGENIATKRIRTNGLFLEVSGASQSYLKTIHAKKVRVDASDHLLNYVRYTLENKHRDKFGRRNVGNITVCSGGYIGNQGDLVVDDFRDPKYVIGISDGQGGFARRLNQSFDVADWCEHNQLREKLI